MWSTAFEPGLSDRCPNFSNDNFGLKFNLILCLDTVEAERRRVFLSWRYILFVEAACPSGLGCWIWNLEVPSSNPSPYRYLDLFLLDPSSVPRPRHVNSQLVSLQSVGILNSLCYIWKMCLLFTMSPISTYSAKYTWHFNKVIIIIIIIIAAKP